jgi:hypothetical protein
MKRRLWSTAAIKLLQRLQSFDERLCHGELAGILDVFNAEIREKYVTTGGAVLVRVLDEHRDYAPWHSGRGGRHLHHTLKDKLACPLDLAVREAGRDEISIQVSITFLNDFPIRLDISLAASNCKCNTLRVI